MPKSQNQIIAELAIKYAADAAEYFPETFECDLRIQIAAAILKATQMQDIIDRAFSQFDNPIVENLFSDGVEKPDLDAHVWDLV